MARERVAQASLSGYLGPITPVWANALITAALAVMPQPLQAQGGPPLVTDDPDTPGDGHWENNLATIATPTAGRWSLASPDADLNYGWGQKVQLNADIPLTLVHDTGGGWDAGLGSEQLAIKWRFLDRPDLGYALSIYPRFTSAWIASSSRRGLADAGHSFFLPVEAATEVADLGLDAEVGRNFAVGTVSQWHLGAIVAHACGRGIECMFEVSRDAQRSRAADAAERWHALQTERIAGAHRRRRPRVRNGERRSAACTRVPGGPELARDRHAHARLPARYFTTMVAIICG